MIRGEHVEDEIKIADKVIENKESTAIDVAKATLKMVTVLAKLLRDVKTNQVTQMIKDGIIVPEEKPVKPTGKDKADKK
jgi:hypothetical protein